MIKKIKSYIPKGEFAKNVLTLMTGATISQALPIAFSPIFTRIYTPDDFGMFALYISISSILSIAATGRYELAIMLPKKNDDAINIVAISIIISFFMSFISLLIIFFFNKKITDLLGNPEISNWLYFIPFTVLIVGIYQSLNYWSNRNKQYKRLATNRVIKSTSIVTSKLGLGLGGFGSGGLIISEFISSFFATYLLGKKIWKEDKKRMHAIKKLKIFVLLKKYKKFPLFSLPKAIIDNFRLSGINILIAKFFSIAVLGQFSLAWKIIQVPMSLIGSSLSQVFFQKVSSCNKNELYIIVIKFIKKSILIASPIFLGIYLLSTNIFVFVFGENWKIAGEAASIMTPWLFFNFLSSPLSLLFIILNKQDILLFFAIFYMAIPLSAIYFFKSLPFLVVLKIITLAMSALLILFIALIIYVLKKEVVK